MTPSASYPNPNQRAGRSKFQTRLLLVWISLWVFVISGDAVAAAYPEECKHYSPPAVIKGNKIFVSTTGEYLPVRGINYYPRPNAGDLVLGNSQDFYTEAFRSSWERDIEQFKALGLNAIRLYAVDPGLNHDAFMCALKAAGIYVIVGLAADCQNCAVQWQDPPLCYPQKLRQRGEFIIQQFARYENVLGFSAGNEIALSAASYLGNLPCQKKFLRDMRSYVQQCTASGSMRQIPVGIIFADHEREVKAKYYNCRTDPTDELENAEFVGINAYLHCDGAATDIDQLIGYKTLLAGVASWGMTIPVLWTEFGCLNPSFEQQGDYQAQRNFLQVDALFSPEYREHFNGGFVFEYSTEKVYSEQSAPYPFTGFGAGNYGVGYFAPENCTGLEDAPCQYIPKPQFHNLASRYNMAASVSKEEVTLNTFNPPPRDPPACPDRIPGLSSFDWPTDFDIAFTRTTQQQCPVLVPVYCIGVPGECVTVPHPGEASNGITAAPTNSPTSHYLSLNPAATDAPSPSSSSDTTSTSPPSLNTGTEGFSSAPAVLPTGSPTTNEVGFITDSPTSRLTQSTTTYAPSAAPVVPTDSPTDLPSVAPTTNPSDVPSTTPSLRPSNKAVETITSRLEGKDTSEPTSLSPTTAPTEEQTLLPTLSPSDSHHLPTPSSTQEPTIIPLIIDEEGTTSHATARRPVLVVLATLAIGMIVLKTI